MKSNVLVLGTFNSESFWRDKNLSTLPAIKDIERSYIPYAMDEMLFPLCNKDDTLITCFKMEETFKSYLHSIGFTFKCSEKSLTDSSKISENIGSKSTCEMLIGLRNDDYFKGLVSYNEELLPYAIFESARELCRTYGLRNNLPEADIVKKVNSKLYSNELIDKIEAINPGVIAKSGSELEEKGEVLLENGEILIKDGFGVSGNGNLLISSPKLLKRISAYIKEQERKGKETAFVVERFLDKEIDFSCQLHICQDGSFNILSIQKMRNSKFDYGGSYSVDQEFIDKLAETDYFSFMQKTAKLLYNDGYWGYVCIDSMLLKDGIIIPIVEINARMSMGLINHFVDSHLSKMSQKGSLALLSLGFYAQHGFDELILKLQKNNLLFTLSSQKGVIPLSSNALFINEQLSSGKNPDTLYKGRLYASVVAEGEEERQNLLNDLRNFLIAEGFKIYN